MTTGAATTLRLGDAAPDFTLPAVDGRTVRLADVTGPHGVVVMFICNHCPYVLAVIDRIVTDMRELRALGIGAVAISSNDARAYPQDGFEPMKAFAARHGLDFPYLYDEPQTVARAYGAACTPDFFGFDAGGRLAYRGRLDASGRGPAGPGTRRELVEAMSAAAEGRAAPAEQVASIGCSIKWK